MMGVWISVLSEKKWVLPSLLQGMMLTQSETIISFSLHVDGMTCEHCVQTARKALLSVDGVSSVCVNLNRKIATITIDKAHNSTSLNSALSNAIEEVGFEANSCSYGSREITIDATKLLRDDSTRSVGTCEVSVL